MDIIHFISVAISLVNIALLSVLLHTFARNYRHIRSSYNIGLLMFSSIFLIQNLISIYFGLFSWPFCGADIVVSQFVLINSIQLAGLVPLFYIKMK